MNKIIKNKKRKKRATKPKTNPPIITSVKNYTKKIIIITKEKTTTTTKITRQIEPRTNGNHKAIQTKSHKGAYTYTLAKREKGEKYIYIIAPKVHLLNLG